MDIPGPQTSICMHVKAYLNRSLAIQWGIRKYTSASMVGFHSVPSLFSSSESVNRLCLPTFGGGEGVD
jgi:hypothetical protein